MLPHLSRMCLEPAEERTREGRAPARLLVLQIDVDPLPARGLADAIGPGAELRVGVVGAPEAEIAEGGGRHRRRRQILAVRDAEGGPVTGEKIVGLVGEPARVAKFEGRLDARRQDGEEVPEACPVEAQVRGELEQKWAELRTETSRGTAEFARDLAGIAQAEEVGDAGEAQVRGELEQKWAELRTETSRG